MERTVTKIARCMPAKVELENVAAYARVSCGKEDMLHSLSAQISYYSSLIQSHKGWIYAGVYADEAKTGTKDTRENFVRLIADCRAGKIDKIITKSISRFARNTVTLLETVRELKALGIDVYFEEQNIHTLSHDGELLLTILASYAQEESRSASENQKWRIRKNFKEGMPWCHVLYGYSFENGEFIVVPEEAEIVKRIYDDYLSGMGFVAIEKKLNEQGLFNRKLKRWSRESIRIILSNYTYTGNLLLQTTYKQDHISKKKVKNNGELPKYLVENTHEAIISTEIFRMVQEERKRRSDEVRKVRACSNLPVLSGKIYCGICKKKYKRKNTAAGAVWICNTFSNYGKEHCPSKRVPEMVLLSLCSELTDDYGDIQRIDVFSENVVKITLKDGNAEFCKWKDRSRRDSWTQEMKEAARQKTLSRRGKYAENNNGYTANDKPCNESVR